MKIGPLKIPFSYSFRNLWTRKLTTALTAAGMGLVVFVFAAVLMLDAGLKQTMVGSGSYDNVVMIRKGSETEIQSGVSRDQASLIDASPSVARGEGGVPMVSKESLILISINKKGQERGSNIVTRGVSPMGLTLRPQVKIIQGRQFRPGSSEVIVGRNVHEQFDGTSIGQTLRFGGREWTIVGIFDAGKSAFDSEVWVDVEQLMQAFRRGNFSSVIAKLAKSDGFDGMVKEIEDDVRLNLQPKREQIFYEDQSRALSTFISYLGLILSFIFSIGAVIGAAITMYSAVATRVAEIGTLRALGFRRPSILIAFLMESLLLALVGGLAGLFFASFLQTITISTLNIQSFSQLAFSFLLTPKIVVQTIIFSLFMGFIGGFLPAVKASRMKIVDSLRAA
jgi:ABC-type antimicrobial peptide transport system permease subunit